MRILAIDPAIRNTGYAVVEGDYRARPGLWNAYHSRSVSQSGCLLAIKQHLGNLIDKWNPDEMAVWSASSMSSLIRRLSRWGRPERPWSLPQRKPAAYYGIFPKA
ncbi:MAG: hypothetical protein ACLSUW_09795 [Akkermansia sp.]